MHILFVIEETGYPLIFNLRHIWRCILMLRWFDYPEAALSAGFDVEAEWERAAVTSDGGERREDLWSPLDLGIWNLGNMKLEQQVVPEVVHIAQFKCWCLDVAWNSFWE
jgi:hypothetical protein